MKILAISGSQRAAARLAAAGVDIVLFDGIAGLLVFNPDLDGGPLPAPVATFRTLIGEADGILISSPEYARGVAGVLKNARDWLVASFEFSDKPAALINASPRNPRAGRADADPRDNVRVAGHRCVNHVGFAGYHERRDGHRCKQRTRRPATACDRPPCRRDFIASG
jgi:NAD(P)H-dependent FMN reductase